MSSSSMDLNSYSRLSEPLLSSKYHRFSFIIFKMNELTVWINLLYGKIALR